MFAKKQNKEHQEVNSNDNQIEVGEESKLEEANQEDETTEWNDGETVPKKKKKLPGWFIIVILVGLFAIGAVGTALFKPKASSAAANLTVIKVGTSDVTEILNTSGVIESEHKKVIYSPVNAKVLSSFAKVGTAVKKGDKLIIFDTKDLEKNNQQQQLTALAGDYSNQDTINKSNEAAQKASQASADAANAQAELDAKQAEMNQLAQQVAAEGGSGVNRAALQGQINENENKQIQAKAARDNAQSIVERINTEYQVKNQESNQAKAALPQAEADLLKLTPGTPEYNAKKGEIDGYKASISYFAKLDQDLQAAAKNVQDSNNSLSGLEQAHRDLVAKLNAIPVATPAQKQLEAVSQRVAALQAAVAENQAKAEGLKSGIMSSAQRSALAANSNLSQLANLSTEELVQMGKDGISAEFDGVIATAPVLEGAMASQGTELFTIVSNSEVGVKIEVSANDYEKLKVGQKASIRLAGKTYAGKVKSVDKIATTNAKGNSVICAYIHISNPDQDICIGVNAKVTMTVEEVKNVVAIPSEIINTATQGEFVYGVKHGVVQKIPIKLGVTSDNMVEVTSGLKKGDQIVSDVGVDIKEGMKANVTMDKKSGTGKASK
ncbi:MAG: efflux RND transporter periplasmic adaptor subunit [Lachnospiraceae bacterium]